MGVEPEDGEERDIELGALEEQNDPPTTSYPFLTTVLSPNNKFQVLTGNTLIYYSTIPLTALNPLFIPPYISFRKIFQDHDDVNCSITDS